MRKLLPDILRSKQDKCVEYIAVQKTRMTVELEWISYLEIILVKPKK